MGNQRKSNPPEANDAGLSSLRRARLLAEQIVNIKVNLERLDDVQDIEGHKETDIIPNMPPKKDESGKVLIEDGYPVFASYGERRAELQAAEARAYKRATAKKIRSLVDACIKQIEAEDKVEEEELLAT